MATSPSDAGAWFIDGDGWCNMSRREVSPNCDERPDGCIADLLVVHNISLPPGEFGGPYIADLFCNRLDYEADPYFDQLRPLRVSAHFLIRRDGEVVQFVSANRRAWHAGVSVFDGRERCNDFSIGIELEGTDTEPFAEAQYPALAKLTAALQERYALTDVAGHEHIAPVRKTDPGPFFDWGRYRNALEEIINGAQLRFPAGPLKSQAAGPEKFEK
jgi:AmpD protein